MEENCRKGEGTTTLQSAPSRHLESGVDPGNEVEGRGSVAMGFGTGFGTRAEGDGNGSKRQINTYSPRGEKGTIQYICFVSFLEMNL